ncbi:MAG TPA: carboxypeptidase regulatory-like domain-containing protein [Candidatus Eisenbacteria bacterium]|jgi:hypothetical protein
MKHLSAEQLSARHDGELSGRRREAVDRHLAACTSCREALDRLSAEDAQLRPALTYDPGAAYFETFAARVEDRLRAAGLKGAQARLGSGGPLAWLRSPRRVAWAGAVAAVVAGAGIVTLTVRDMDRPGLRNEWTELRPAPSPPDRKATAPAVVNEKREDAPDDLRAGRPPARAAEGELDRAAPSEPEASAGYVSSSGERESPARSALETTNAPEAGGAPSPALSQQAAPGRLHKVRRTSAGEEVPVKSEEPRFASPPAAATPATGSPARAPRPSGAWPLEGHAQPTLEGASDRAAGARKPGELSLCGRVLDPAGRPVVGAQVALADNLRIATTDGQGGFCLTSPPGQHDLTVMAVGFYPTRQQVRVMGPSSETAVTLQPVSVLGQASGPLARTQSEVLRGPAQDREAGGVPGSANPAFSGLSESLRAAVQSAEQLSAVATALRSAAAFDGAAAAWERVSESVPPGPPRVAARFALASARYGAWVNGRSSSRERAARHALASFLEVAPPGRERAEARRWLKRLGR